MAKKASSPIREQKEGGEVPQICGSKHPKGERPAARAADEFC